MKDGVVTVAIAEDDIKMQLKLWESALIGYVVGDHYMRNRSRAM